MFLLQKGIFAPNRQLLCFCYLYGEWLPACVCEHRTIQHWTELFNFCFHLYQLHLIGGQFWIDFFLPAVEYLKVFELLLHGRENELLNFFFVDFSVAQAVLAFCPFDTAALKINAAALNGRINLSAVRRLFFFCRRAAEWFGYYWWTASASSCVSWPFLTASEMALSNSSTVE